VATARNEVLALPPKTGRQKAKLRPRARPTQNRQQVDKQNSRWESVSRYPRGNGNGDPRSGMGTGGLPAEIGTTMQNQHPKVNSRAAGNSENMALATAKFAYTDLGDCKGLYLIFTRLNSKFV